MSVLVWDKSEDRRYESGVSKGVLFPKKTDGTDAYENGVAWSGLTGVTESPSGADVTDLWADNIKYASLRAEETFGATIEAYTYPDEFEECNGLGLIPGKVEKIVAPDMVIPHMGWNKLEMQHDCPILRNMPEESYVYFVHSYQAVVPDEYLAAYVEYGPAKIPAMVYDGKTVYGAQFHPEKSGEIGLQILRNFGGLIQ